MTTAPRIDTVTKGNRRYSLYLRRAAQRLRQFGAILSVRSQLFSTVGLAARRRGAARWRGPSP